MGKINKTLKKVDKTFKWGGATEGNCAKGAQTQVVRQVTTRRASTSKVNGRMERCPNVKGEIRRKKRGKTNVTPVFTIRTGGGGTKRGGRKGQTANHAGGQPKKHEKRED